MTTSLMSTLLFIVLRYLLIVTLNVTTAAPHGCPDGWFGITCTLQCHCNFKCDPENAVCLHGSCDVKDGHCPPEVPCQSGFFGPGCQFVNIAFTDGHISNPSFLRDEDETTCNEHLQATSVSLKLSSQHKTIWFRLKLAQMARLDQVIARWDDTINVCPDVTTFLVDNNTLDIVCSQSGIANTITVQGPIAAQVCSIIVSGGRNVAIKEHTYQGSSASVTEGYSHLAVDGNINTRYSDCIHTKPDSGWGYWEVTFAVPRELNRVVIYNSDYFASNSQFSLGFYDTKKKLLVRYKTPPVTPKIFQDPVLWDMYVTILSIDQVGAAKVWLHRTLNLCEVQVYSHALCPNGTYGFYCERSCSFCPGLFCSPFTGQCAQACAPPRKGLRCEDCPDGTYGVLCDRKCSDTCLNGLCHHFTGNCLNCQGNVTGSRCEACTLGHYGDSCTENCSTQCVKLECEKSFGHCMACNSPRTGEFCEECPERTFGIDCTEICIPKCNIGYCHHLTGDCLKCLGNFTGSQCKECIATAHGPNCTLSCPEFCLEQTCDDFTADCPLCQGVRSGPKCEECPQGTYGGADCSENCSQFCLGGQCRTDGSCLECKSRRLGAQCDMCPPGTYGPECLSQCPPFCAKSVCQSLSGNCFRCKSGRIGSTCEECPPNQYGPNCSLTCSFTCFNAECDKNSGECSRCIEGFKGPMCSEAEKEKGGAWLLLLLLPIPIVALSLFCISRRNNTSSEEEGLPEQNIKLSRVASDLRHE